MISRHDSGFASLPDMQSPSTEGVPLIKSQHPRLKIATTKHISTFLQAIQIKFLEVVNPRESGLLDYLTTADLITDTDNESMSGKHVNTRKDQARKLWILFNKMSVENFNSKVAPELYKKFPHIIPQDFILKDGEEMPMEDEENKECLRHTMRETVREASLADMLSSYGCLCLEGYEDIVSGQCPNDLVWNKMLECFTDHPDDVNSDLLTSLKTLLAKYKVPVPDNLPHLLVRGIPCTCGKEPAAPPFTRTLPPSKKASLDSLYKN